MKERWKIIDWAMSYSVSDHGRIKRVQSGRTGQKAGSLLKLRPIKVGSYLTVSLYYPGGCRMVYVHQLVASAFIGRCPKGKEHNHKDANKQNNHWRNLEYVTKSENAKHRCNLGIGLPPILKGKDHHWFGQDNSGANNAMFGRSHTRESKLKMSESRRRGFAVGTILHPWIGRKHTPEANEKNRAAHLGRTPSEETRQRMSISQRRRAKKKKRQVVSK